MSRAAVFPASHALPDLRLPRPAGLLGRLVARTALRRSRHGLEQLDDHLLRDVGLSRDEARREAARPAWDALDEAPWDAPAHWLR